MKDFLQIITLVLVVYSPIEVSSIIRTSTNITGAYHSNYNNTNPNKVCEINKGADISGADVGSQSGVSDPSLCCDICLYFSGCQYWSWTDWNEGSCWLKAEKGNLVPASDVSWGKSSSSDGLSVRVLQYNLYGWNVFGQNLNTKGVAIVNYMAEKKPDFIGAEECEGYSDWILQRLSGYAASGDEKHGVNIFYKKEIWIPEESGFINIPEQDQWGQRVMRFTKFKHIETGKRLAFYTTHWCVCSDAKLLNTAEAVAVNILEFTPEGYGAILTGDLNVFDNFENGMAVRYLKGLYGNNKFPMRDTFRDLFPNADGSTFGAAGKIDYIFASGLLTTDYAEIDRSATVSDHYPVIAEVLL